MILKPQVLTPAQNRCQTIIKFIGYSQETELKNKFIMVLQMILFFLNHSHHYYSL